MRRRADHIDADPRCRWSVTPVLAKIADRLERAVDMGTGFDMHRDVVGARFGERFEIRIAGRDHQMNIERLAAARPQRLHDVGPNGDVGDKMSVHHIDMDPVRTGFIDCAHLLAELGKVPRKDRRRDDEAAMHRFLPLRRASERAPMPS
jgi:hypothetical protein